MKQMNYFKMLLACALVLALASCENISPVEKPIEQGGQGGRTVKLGLQLEPGTKVTLSDEDKFAWEEGDKIAVLVGANASSGHFIECAVNASNEITVSLNDGEDVIYAVYPSHLSETIPFPAYSEDKLSINLPSSYNFSEVSYTDDTQKKSKTPLPMVGVKTVSSSENTLVFYNVGGMLRLTVKRIPTDATGLDIQFPGKKVNGTFVVSKPGTNEPSISTGATTENDKIRITFDAGIDTATVNIPLPTGEYGEVFVTPVGGSTKVAAIRHIKAGGYTAVRAKGKLLTATMVSFTVNSSNKKVIIAPGNLQATYNSGADEDKKWTWHFAASQWEFMGNTTGSSNLKINGNGTVSNNGTVDLFAWVGASNTTWSGDLGTTGNAAMHGITNATTMGNETDYGNTIAESLKSDWGKTINDGNAWRTLNKDEWTHLLSSRSGGTANGTSKARLTYATITDLNVNGFILFPDGVTIGSDEVTSWGKINGDSGSTKTQCTSAQWTDLEAKGCVFLPAAGHRRYFSSKWELTSDNYYWSSSYRGDNNQQAVAKGFDNLTGEAGIKRQRGCAVRLVHDL